MAVHKLVHVCLTSEQEKRSATGKTRMLDGALCCVAVSMAFHKLVHVHVSLTREQDKKSAMGETRMLEHYVVWQFQWPSIN